MEETNLKIIKQKAQYKGEVEKKDWMSKRFEVEFSVETLQKNSLRELGLHCFTRDEQGKQYLTKLVPVPTTE